MFFFNRNEINLIGTRIVNNRTLAIATEIIQERFVVVATLATITISDPL